jgi:hypothetical protein
MTSSDNRDTLAAMITWLMLPPVLFVYLVLYYLFIAVHVAAGIDTSSITVLHSPLLDMLPALVRIAFGYVYVVMLPIWGIFPIHKLLLRMLVKRLKKRYSLNEWLDAIQSIKQIFNEQQLTDIVQHAYKD